MTVPLSSRYSPGQAPLKLFSVYQHAILDNLFLPCDDRVFDLFIDGDTVIDRWCEGLSELWRVDRFVDERNRLREEMIDSVVGCECDGKAEDPTLQLAGGSMFEIGGRLTMQRCKFSMHHQH